MAESLEHRAAPRARRLYAGRLPCGTLLGAAVALFVAFPNTVVRPKMMLGIEVLGLCLVAAAVASLPGIRRWTLAPTMLSAFGATTMLSVVHYGQFSDLLNATIFTALMVGSALAAANFTAPDREALLNTLLWVAGVELLFGIAEQFAGVAAPWGYLKQQGQTFGNNDVLTFLSGRATGTMGHPIPFGTLMAVAALASIFAKADASWRVRGTLAAGFAFGVLLSGSRSAVIALVICVVIGFLTPADIRHAGRVRLITSTAAILVVLFGNLQNSRVISSLSGTGSIDHRLAALQSFSKLNGRSTVQVLFGSGYNSTDALFRLRLLQQDNFMAIDNQLITCVAIGGLVGVAAVLIVVAAALATGDRGIKPEVLLLLLMFFSFDLLSWFSTMELFAVMVGLASARSRAAGPAGIRTSARAGDGVRVPVTQ